MLIIIEVIMSATVLPSRIFLPVLLSINNKHYLNTYNDKTVIFTTILALAICLEQQYVTKCVALPDMMTHDAVCCDQQLIMTHSLVRHMLSVW